MDFRVKFAPLTMVLNAARSAGRGSRLPCEWRFDSRSLLARSEGSFSGRGNGDAFEFHHHHDGGQAVAGPASKPCHDPIAEPRANRDRCAKAEELGSWLHGADRCESPHACLCGEDGQVASLDSAVTYNAGQPAEASVRRP
jgi:hypothetical protein